MGFCQNVRPAENIFLQLLFHLWVRLEEGCGKRRDESGKILLSESCGSQDISFISSSDSLILAECQNLHRLVGMAT
jgi:hypothetical protein